MPIRGERLRFGAVHRLAWASCPGPIATRLNLLLPVFLIWGARRLPVSLRIAVGGGLHNETRQRLHNISFTLSVPGQLLDAAGLLPCQRDKSLLAAQPLKLCPQQFAF